MTKLKQPILSLESSGTLSDSLTFQRSRRTNIARATPKPVQPNTIAQLYHRWDYHDYAYIWSLLPQATKNEYRTKGSRYHLTAFAYWMKVALAALTYNACRLRIDEGSGTYCYDSSKNQNNGTIIGATWKQKPNGLPYLDFNGVGNLVKVLHHATIMPLDAITVLGWVKNRTLDATHRLLCRKSSAYGVNGYALSFHSGVRFYTSNSKQAYAPPLNTNQLYFIAGTYDRTLSSNQMKLYIDAQLGAVQTNTLPLVSNTLNLELGGTLDGGICQFEVMSRALTSNEVKAYYQRTKPHIQM